jgi:uncharacterized membrane protein YebE (DUF533 family)
MPIDALLNSANGKTALTGFLSGAAGGAIAGSLTKSKSAKKILKAGGLMAVGGLALKAWQTHSAQKDAASGQVNQTGATPNAATPLAAQPAPQLTAEAAPAATQEVDAGLILQSMIAAAHADGVLSTDEQTKIWQQAVESGLPAEELALLSNALANPLSVAELAQLTNTMEEKIEAYTAAAVVVDEGCADGQQFLNQLGAQFQLPAGLTNALLTQLRRV